MLSAVRQRHRGRDEYLTWLLPCKRTATFIFFPSSAACVHIKGHDDPRLPLSTDGIAAADSCSLLNRIHDDTHVGRVWKSKSSII